MLLNKGVNLIVVRPPKVSEKWENIGDKEVDPTRFRSLDAGR